MTDVEEYRLTPDQAKFLNDQIKSTIQELEDLLSEFISGEGWLALGYDTAWDWWNKEVGQKRLGGSVRDKVILQFKEEGASVRKAASAVGASPTTVQKLYQSGTPEVIEPTEILPATVNGKSAEDLESELKELLAERRANAEPSVPYDLTPDKAILYDMELLNRHLDIAVKVSKKDLSSNVRAKVRIELQILRDMIDMIEENL